MSLCAYLTPTSLIFILVKLIKCCQNTLTIDNFRFYVEMAVSNTLKKNFYTKLKLIPAIKVAQRTVAIFNQKKKST